VVKVTDTGHGISKENQSKIFKEIVQFHPEILQAVCFIYICMLHDYRCTFILMFFFVYSWLEFYI
jgi:hypothetical protein